MENEDAQSDVCVRAIQKFGADKQIDMSLEELAELMKAIVKYRRHNWNAVWRIKTIEEICDVEMMLLQLRFILNVKDEEYNRIKKNKISNLNSIIENDDPLRKLNTEKK